MVVFLTWYLPVQQVENSKVLAQKIIDFRSETHSCEKLKTLYIESYYKKYNSLDDLSWFWEVNERIVSDGCTTRAELDNIEFIEICQDGRGTECAISKIENPELYEDFDFKSAIKNLKPVNGSGS